MRSLRVWIFVALLLASTTSCKVDPCQEAVTAVAHCDRVFHGDVCSDDQRCHTECYGRATCDELTRYADGKEVPSLEACFWACLPRFQCGDGTQIYEAWVCDGEKDCLDGSDEKRCRYFECDSGELTSRQHACDGFEDCSDGSDEMQCP